MVSITEISSPGSVRLPSERLALLDALPLTAQLRQNYTMSQERWDNYHQLWEVSQDRFARITNQALLLYNQLYNAKNEASNYYYGLLTTTHFHTAGIAQTFLSPALRQLEEILEILLASELGKTLDQEKLIESFDFPPEDIAQLEADIM